MPPPPIPPKQIKNLNLTDIHKMDIKDLQKLDYIGFLKDAKRRPDVALSLVVIPALTLFVCFHLFFKSGTEQKTLKADVLQREEKIIVVDEYTKLQGDLAQFFKTLPNKISENEFVDKITEFAVKRRVQIESFAPTKNQSDPLYDLTVINLNVETKNYTDMWLFIHDIEHSGFNIRINNWVGTMGPRGQGAGGSRYNNRDPAKADDSWINVRLEIATVSFKNEK